MPDLHPEALAPDRLFVLGGYTPADGRVSWLPAGATGFQPSNSYLLLEGGRALLVDTGIAAFEATLLDQLAGVLPEGTPLEVFLTRAELDCIGNLGPITDRFSVTGLRTGGTNNPFDAFDGVAAVQDGRVTIHRDMGRPIALSDSRSLHILNAPLRLLATYWAYDDATRTLFTSDSFCHVMVGRPGESRIAPDSAAVDDAEVEAHLLTKLDWLRAAATTRIVASLEEVFASYDVEAIAPANGGVIRGRAQVARHRDAMLRVLARQRPPAVVSAGPPPPEAPAAPRQQVAERFLPREIAPSIHWLGGCLARPETQFRYHVHQTPYLLLGARETLLVDTGHAAHWTKVEADLDQLLGGRQLDWILPTHTETPHCGNLNRLMARYPEARMIGDFRDYHLHYPNHRERLVGRRPGDVIDIGGMCLTLLDAVIRDLPCTLWAYESSRQVLFVADAFGYTHAAGDTGDPVHSPGECGLLSSELPSPPTIEQTAFLTKAALYWTRYVDIRPYFARVEELMRRYPTKLVAPAHANVISDLEALMPLMHRAYQMADAI